MLTAVRGLVEAEQLAASAADTLAATGGLLRGDGGGLLQRIVSYFQQLFSVPHIDGVLTAISQVLNMLLENPLVRTCICCCICDEWCLTD